jgi:tol-pal system protein YbgF
MAMMRNVHRAALAAAAVVMVASSALAQDRPGLLDNLFNRGGDSSQSQGQMQDAPQSSSSDLAVRLDRMENRLREMTGQLEQLQFRNQQLEQDLARLGGSSGGSPAAVPPQRGGAPNSAPMASPQQAMPPQNMPAQGMPPASTSGKRSDVFDPSANPNAPGAPRTLGSGGPAQNVPRQDFAVGAPGGGASGAPLDLSGGTPQMQTASADPGAALPGPPPRNTSRTGQQLATLPPSSTPKDQYDLAYGYVLHKDYDLAQKAFADFIKRNPGNELTPEAHYWLGESFFQRQKYQDAADSYLVVVRNHEKADKAPDSLLRLGQSLAALGQKEMACASLGEVSRKYPRASASVKRGVTQEQKRAHC